MSRKLKESDVKNRFKDKNLKLLSNYKKSNIKVKCQCFCGKIFDVEPNKVFNGHTKSCGCYVVYNKSLRKDISGKKFGKLIAIQDVGKDPNDNVKWKCLCHCGNKIVATIGSLTSGHTQSCGCGIYQYKKGKYNYRWKGFQDIPIRYWHNIKNMALKRKIDFNISIEDAWEVYINQNKRCVYINEIIPFSVDSSLKNNIASVDRIDSSKGYCKDNIQWIHKDINNIKWDMTEEEFFYWIDILKNPIKNKYVAKDCNIRNHHKNWKGYGNISSTYFSRLKYNAIKRKKPFEISIEDIWNIFLKQKGRCSLTNIELKIIGSMTASLDRIDNNHGYIKNNVHWVHKDINCKIKKDMELNHLFALIGKINNESS